MRARGASRRRTDRILIRVPPDAVLELAADSSRFPEFNPLVDVPDGGRVEVIGAVYHQVTRGPLKLSMRWETTHVDPPDLASSPRPSPPWTTVEIGDVPLFGRCVSTTRYDSAAAGTLVTHDLDYQVPDGLIGPVVDTVVIRPLLAVSLPILIRWLRRWIEAAKSGSSSPQAPRR